MFVRQQILSPPILEEGSRFASEAINHMAVIDALGTPFIAINWGIDSRQFHDLLVAQKAE
jgi:hypothetical protein